MSHTVRLRVRLSRGIVQLDDCCLNFRYEKERYTPYTMLSGQWYCPSDFNIGEIAAFQFYIDDVMIHMGYPSSAEIIKKDGRLILKLSSNGYSSALMTNQCPDGLISDVNLQGLINAADFTLPNIAYQKDTPVVNYVNYYDGTSLWDAIVCYSLRVGGKHYPYLSGYNTIRIEPVDEENIYEVSSSDLISRSSKTDYSRLISKITMKGVDGTPAGYTLTNPLATQRTIVKCREINYDREWIMAPGDGLQYKLNYSMREVNSDSFSFFGYTPLDLLDRLSVPDLSYEGEVDRLVVTANAEKDFITTVWCYHDRYCK